MFLHKTGCTKQMSSTHFYSQNWLLKYYYIFYRHYLLQLFLFLLHCQSFLFLFFIQIFECWQWLAPHIEGRCQLTSFHKFHSGLWEPRCLVTNYTLFLSTWWGKVKTIWVPISEWCIPAIARHIFIWWVEANWKRQIKK